MSGRKLLLDSNIVIYIDEEVVLKVISIRQTRKMKLPDAIIAATALIHDCMLITRNISDFSGLPGLVFLDPLDL